jgi:hypothetical protein
MTLIERVAQALCQAHTGKRFDEKLPVVQWCFLEDARAAIAAMPEPTEAMIDAMISKANERGANIGVMDVQIIYQAAIDAATFDD